MVSLDGPYTNCAVDAHSLFLDVRISPPFRCIESALEVTASALSRSSANSGGSPPPFTLAASIPYGLSPDDLISPFPHSLTSIAPSNPAHHHSNGPGRKPRAGGARGAKEALSGVSALALGKAIGQLNGCKEADIDHDLGNIRRAQKRRRAAVRAAGGAMG